MAEITPQGPVKKTLAEYKAEREQDWKDAFGPDLNVDPETPQGQIIGIESFALSEADDSVIDVANLLNLFEAVGLQLDGLFSLLAIPRLPASKTLVTVDLTGEPATLIPAGSKCKTTEGVLFSIRDDVILDGTGAAEGTAQALDFGPIQVAVNTLTEIVDIVPGWETIDNSMIGVPGENQETDEEYLRRYLRSLSINARSPLDSVLAGVLAVENVIEALVADNDQSFDRIIDGVLFPEHSIGVAVQGGVDIDIAEAIQLKKTIGALTIGEVTVTLPQAKGNGDDGPTIDISFFRVSEIRTVIEVEITINNKFPANGVGEMKQAVAEYFAGGFPDTDVGTFETDGIGIAEDVKKSRLYTPINSVPGHVVDNLILKQFGGSDVEILVVDFNERAVIESLDDIIIVILP